MTTHGENKPGVTMGTNTLLGCFRNDSTTRQEFL
ncbi:MAG: GTP cyclohydrolase I FolE, partial [Alphaproteobacteria bacterium]|nr:GTP cyclohydrolase I FolE [Alphaproteobacteria bacterium]